MRLWDRVPAGVKRCDGCGLSTAHLHPRAVALAERWLCDVCYLIGSKIAPTVRFATGPLTLEPEGPPMTTAEQVTDYIQKSDADTAATAQLGEAKLAFARAQEMLALAQQASDTASVTFNVAWHDLTKLLGTDLQPGVYLLADERALYIAASAPTEAPRPAPVMRLA